MASNPGTRVRRLDDLYSAAILERDAVILRRLQGGESMAQVARSLGLTRARVSQIAHRDGIPKRTWTRR